MAAPNYDKMSIDELTDLRHVMQDEREAAKVELRALVEVLDRKMAEAEAARVAAKTPEERALDQGVGG